MVAQAAAKLLIKRESVPYLCFCLTLARYVLTGNKYLKPTAVGVLFSLPQTKVCTWKESKKKNHFKSLRWDRILQKKKKWRKSQSLINMNIRTSYWVCVWKAHYFPGNALDGIKWIHCFYKAFLASQYESESLHFHHEIFNNFFVITGPTIKTVSIAFCTEECLLLSGPWWDGSKYCCCHISSPVKF